MNPSTVKLGAQYGISCALAMVTISNKFQLPFQFELYASTWSTQRRMHLLYRFNSPNWLYFRHKKQQCHTRDVTSHGSSHYFQNWKWLELIWNDSFPYWNKTVTWKWLWHESLKLYRLDDSIESVTCLKLFAYGTTYITWVVIFHWIPVALQRYIISDTVYISACM